MHCWPSIKQQTKEWWQKAAIGAWQETFKPMFALFLLLPCVRWLWTGKPVNKAACWDSQENFHQTLQLHATLFTAHWCLFLFLFGHSPVSWFTVMTGRTISGSETTVCCLCRVTTRVTLIYWACFLQVDTRYYNAWKCPLHINKLYMQINVLYITCQSMCLIGFHSD